MIEIKLAEAFKAYLRTVANYWEYAQPPPHTPQGHRNRTYAAALNRIANVLARALDEEAGERKHHNFPRDVTTAFPYTHLPDTDPFKPILREYWDRYGETPAKMMLFNQDDTRRVYQPVPEILRAPLHAPEVRDTIPPTTWRNLEPSPDMSLQPGGIRYFTDRKCLRVEVRHPKSSPYAKHTEGIGCYAQSMKDALEWVQKWPGANEVHITPHDPHAVDGGTNRLLERGLETLCKELEARNASLNAQLKKAEDDLANAQLTITETREQLVELTKHLTPK